MADNSYFCTQCSYQSEWKFQLDHHVERNHTDVYATDPIRFLMLDECQRDDFITHYKLALDKHCPGGSILNQSLDQSIKCKHCVFTTHSALMSIKHGRCKTERNQIELLILPSAGSFGNNKAKHCNYNCVHCSYKTNRLDSLKKHNLVHLPREAIQWFKCDYCPHEAKQKRYLKKHMLQHANTGPKPVTWFKCEQCSYKTKQSGRLTQHIFRHTFGGGEAKSEAIKWFKCTQCTYMTKFRKNLSRHMVRHVRDDEAKWFECAQCPYRVKWKAHLKRHLMIHAPDDRIKWYDCEQCSFQAKSASSLRRHKLTHAGDQEVKWHGCDQCSYKTKERNNLKRHMLAIHQIDMNTRP